MASSPLLYGDSERYINLMRETESLGVAKLFARKNWYLVSDAVVADYFFKRNVPRDRIFQVIENGAFLSDALKLPPSPSSVFVVATRRSEHAVLGALRRRGVKALGLLSQVLPRLAAGAPPRLGDKDVRNEAVPVRKVALVGAGRIFAEQLTDAFRQTATPRTRKHFGKAQFSLLQHRSISDFEPSRWWNLLLRAHAQDETFFTTLDWPAFKKFRDHLLPNEQSWLDRKFKGFKIIRLKSSSSEVTAAYDIAYSSVNLEPGAKAKSLFASAKAREALLAPASEVTEREQQIDEWLDLVGAQALSVADHQVASDPWAVKEELRSFLGRRFDLLDGGEPSKGHDVQREDRNAVLETIRRAVSDGGSP